MTVRYRLIFWILIMGLLLWPLFLPGYFSHHDDLQVMRIVEMRKCILDLQIPCRWVPDMGYGNGYPLFNYYSVVPYYIGAILSIVVGFVIAAKLLFAIPLILGAFSIYLLAKEIFGRLPAVLAVVLFSFAPYKALDIYVRGAIAESFAMAIIPFSFYFALKLIKQREAKYLIGLAISLAAFLASHNIMTLLFIPVFLVFVIFFLILEKGKNIFPVISGIILGIGLSSFFIFPAYFEKNLVQIDNLIRLDLNFRAHFVTFSQLFFSRFWGYGASSPDVNDSISFQIGWPHWWIVAVAGVLAVINFVKRRKYIDLLAIIFIAIFFFSILMTHIKSAFIWEQIEVLKFTQFPWRFLSVTIFVNSLIGAYLVYSVKEKYKTILVVVLIVFTIILNWSYFKPGKFYFDIGDQQKLSGELWEEQQKAAILDYLPQTAVQPREAASNIPIVKSGKATAQQLRLRSNSWEFKVKVDEPAVIEVPVFDFPNWEVFVNGKKVEHSNKNHLGRISINLDQKGEYRVSGKFKDTPIRLIFNTVTLLSFLALLWLVFYGKNNKNFK